MTPATILRNALALPLEDQDGEPVVLELLPPLSSTELHAFEQQLPAPLPDDIRELLELCSGIDGSALDPVSFTGRGVSFEHLEVFPFGLPIAGDGFGNFWVVDLVPGRSTWGPVYFACHDAPVILYQSDSLTTFLSELIKMSMPPHASLINDVHDDRLFEVWSKNPGVQSHDACLASSDAVLAEFARSLDSSFEIIDLRNAPVGFGFSWGRYGPQTVVRRAGYEPIFACKREKLSWFKKLFL